MRRYLVLADGTVFEGEGFGAPVEAVGELVFNTGAAGYIEALTDPGYFGQILMQTFPLAGNYGVIEDDFEGACHARGYVVRAWCDAPSNFRSQCDLDAFLKARGVPGICGIDTRAATQHIRDNGVMNAMICARVPEDLDGLRAYAVSGAVAATGARARRLYPPQGHKRRDVTLVDCGARRSLVRALQARGCAVTAVPADTPAGDILAGKPDGVVLSNGPGDPAENAACVAQVRALLGKTPLFGVGLGHQLLALAAGGRTEKLKHGHRGDNQPVTDLRTGRTWITGQNHGYAVVAERLPEGHARFVNANDQTCEGADYPGLRAFGVQFQPDACAGPAGTAFLFDRFMDLMGGAGLAAE